MTFLRTWIVVVVVAALWTPAVLAAGGEAGDRPVYRVGVEDVLEIQVWKNEDVSRQVWVRPDGRITLPLVGEVAVEGLTPQEITDRLTAKFQEYLNDPVVTVSLVEINSYTVYLLGRVTTPGAVRLRSPRTFLQVLAMAGGFQEFADTDNIVLVRWAGGKEDRIPINADKIIRKGSEHDFVLQPGDVVIVP